VGEAFIAKRMDRFLLSKDLVLSSGIFRSWVEFPFISDHVPILLRLEVPPMYKEIPFKFNPVWLSERDFITLVHKLWNDPLYLQESCKKKRMVWKLKYLKKNTKSWLKIHNSLKIVRLSSLEQEISYRFHNLSEGLCQDLKDISLKDLEKERTIILKDIEEQWC